MSQEFTDLLVAMASFIAGILTRHYGKRGK